MSSRTSILAIGAAALLLTGCGDDPVAVYRVPKEKDAEIPMAAAADAGAPSAPAPGAGMADTAVPTASGEALAWQAPAAWAPKAPSAMRKGSYSVPGEGGEADLSITAFPGDVGGELANVNRWRGQIGLTPLGPEELDASVSRFDQGGPQGHLGRAGLEGRPERQGHPRAPSCPSRGRPGSSSWRDPGPSVRRPSRLSWISCARCMRPDPR
jgi:hypothetical protein